MAKQRREILVSEVVGDFLATAEVKKLSKKTKDEYRYVLNVFAEWCDTHALTQKRDHRTWIAPPVDEKNPPITLARVNDQAVSLFLEYLQQTHKPSRNDSTELSSSTLVLYVKDIKRLLNWCLMDDVYALHIQDRTVKKILKPKLEEKIKETFTNEQVDALFRACNKEISDHLRVRDQVILSMLLDSGLRATELCTLTIGNVCLDADDAYVRVHGKGNKWGEVGIGEKARRVIKKYIYTFREPVVESDLEKERNYRSLPTRQQQQMKRQRLANLPVVASRTGNAMTRNGLLQLVYRLSGWAGIDEELACHPHIFRHTFARMFMENGGDIYVLSRLLRHTSVKVTEQYLKALGVDFARKNAKSVLDNL